MQPAGPLSKAMETLRAMLSRSATFLAFMNVKTAADAILRTYLTSTPPAQGLAGGDGSKEYTPGQWENSLRPFCLCYTSPTGGYRITRESRYGFQERGKLVVELETNMPSGADIKPETADRWIHNLVGQIIEDLVNNAGQLGNLDIAEIAVALGPCRERFEEEGGAGEYYWTLLELTYGPD